MKRRMILFLIAAFLFSRGLYGEDGRITVEVSGIKKIAGQLIISLYDKPEGFPNTRNTKETVCLTVGDSTVTHVFSNLAPGDYALAVIHDANSNNKLDTNFFGLPKEKYGFSRNARAFLKAPSFRKAKFTLITTCLVKIKL